MRVGVTGAGEHEMNTSNPIFLSESDLLEGHTLTVQTWRGMGLVSPVMGVLIPRTC
jgi:hypothetical protein